MITDSRFRLAGDSRYGDRLDDARGHMRSSHLWSENFNSNNFNRRVTRAIQLTATDDPTNPRAQTYDLDQACGSSRHKFVKREVCPRPTDEKPKDPLGGRNTLSLEKDIAYGYPSDDDLDFTKTEKSELTPDTKRGPQLDMEKIENRKITLVRIKGELKSFLSAAKPALQAAAVVGEFLGAIVVILDFVSGNWVAGALGAVGLVAGAVAGLVASGPIGWAIAAAIAFFSRELVLILNSELC